MSVTAETSQPAMGPYVAMAAVGLALYAWTAVCREALVVKVPGGGDGDGGGGGIGDGGGGGGGIGDGGGGGIGDGGGGGIGDGGGGDKLMQELAPVPLYLPAPQEWQELQA